jgi:hypothetical protein
VDLYCHQCREGGSFGRHLVAPPALADCDSADDDAEDEEDEEDEEDVPRLCRM